MCLEIRFWKFLALYIRGGKFRTGPADVRKFYVEVLKMVLSMNFRKRKGPNLVNLPSWEINPSLLGRAFQK